jgi:hypothetical protein
MKNTKLWASISLFNFCIVGLVGVILRSKILFDLPWINYLNLLDAHSHFAFGGWITLALLMLFVRELLPGLYRNKNIYQWMFGSIFLGSAGSLLTATFGVEVLKDFFSVLFIVTTYIFSWAFIKHIRGAALTKTVYLLSVSAIVCLILSSLGPITISCLHAMRSVQSVYYRDALYIYLHFQYNGFFTLAVFALLFQKLYAKIQKEDQKNFYWFALLLCLSTLPSLFLSFLWQAPNETFRVIAATGSILVFASVTWFIRSSLAVLKLSGFVRGPLRYMILLSIGAFILKMILQSLTIFTGVGNAVFGDRPVIIGFLHLVFLGFVSPFIVAYYTQENILNVKVKLAIHAQIIFIVFVVCNELALMVQGVGAMFLKSSHWFSWALWIISIGLLVGVVLTFVAVIKSAALSLKLDEDRRELLIK